MDRVREQRRAGLDVAQPEADRRIELAAAAEPGLLYAEIGPRRGQEGVEAVALRRRRAVGIKGFAQRHREALSNPLGDRADFDRAQFGIRGTRFTVGIERRPTAA